jgi:invasion protein IalB
MKLTRLILALALTTAVARAAGATEVETRKEFGIWSVKCVKQPPGSTPEDCSIGAGGVAPDNAEHWAKVGVTIVGHNSDPKMTLRVPGITPVGDGISLSFDGRQYGRVFIRYCDFSHRVCETTFNVDAELQSLLATKEAMSVEYKFAADQSTYIDFELKHMLEALGYLAKLVDPQNDAMASAMVTRYQTPTVNKYATTIGCCERDPRNQPLQFVVERRESPYNFKLASFARVWEAPLQKCPSLPAQREVSVNVDSADGRVANVIYTIQNEPGLTKWLSQSAQCSQDQEPVFWIRAKSHPGKEAPSAKEILQTEPSVNPVSLASQTLYKSVKKAGATAGIVPNEGVAPTLPPQRGLVASDSPMNSYNSIK